MSHQHSQFFIDSYTKDVEKDFIDDIEDEIKLEKEEQEEPEQLQVQVQKSPIEGE